VPLPTDFALGTGHTGADAIEVGVDAGRPTCILHIVREVGLAKGGTGLPM